VIFFLNTFTTIESVTISGMDALGEE